MVRVGDIVRYWFDTGAFGYVYIYGIVEKAGPKRFTVRWESGIRNRPEQGSTLVTLVTDPEELELYGSTLSTPH